MCKTNATCKNTCDLCVMTGLLFIHVKSLTIQILNVFTLSRIIINTYVNIKRFQNSEETLMVLQNLRETRLIQKQNLIMNNKRGEIYFLSKKLKKIINTIKNNKHQIRIYFHFSET